MAKFATVPVEEIVPQRKQRQPSNRARIQAQYQQALRDAVEKRQALVVDLEYGDKPLTIRNRINRAAQVLGLDQVVIRRRGSRIVAYQPQQQEQLELPDVEEVEEVPKVGIDDALGG